MAENTLQYDWIVKLKENLEILFADRPDVLVAANIFWYPVPDRHITGPMAPDVLVAFGRPKGRRGCYKQWEEGNIPPQVVFEVRSPSNSQKELRDKLEFYDTYGAEEYYLLDPERKTLDIWLRQNNRFRSQRHLSGWISPRLGIRLALTREGIDVFYPDNRPFLSPLDMSKQMRELLDRLKQQESRAAQEHARAEQALARAKEAEADAARLRERLRALGLDPDAADPNANP
jgi:Uma2 family endonuclease